MNITEETNVAILEAAGAENIRLRIVAPGQVELLESICAIINGVLITIPKGFRCDAASIPKPFRRLMGHPLTKRYLLAALFHDWLVRARPWTQRIVSRAFYAQLRQSGNGLVRARIMYIAVRFWGPRW